ncbi:MAG: Gldg family protein [Gammaproteobacteria bacterium]|nr:Gldg family protein [Gammaproteobacteria bacterium]
MKLRRVISGTGLLLAAALAISVIIVANAVFTSLRLDLTSGGLYTLSEGSRNILKKLDEPIALEFYFSRQALADFPQLMNYATRVRDLLEEYATRSGGKLKLTVIEPEPFSEQEDQAVAGGLQGISLTGAGDNAYFGLVGINSTDDKDTIPFFQVNREAALEYDITKMIYNLANPEKRRVGVITSLPVFGGIPPQGGKPWTIISLLREFFAVENLGPSPATIDQDLNVLLVIHPKELKDAARYALDQFLLRGGKAILFVDPLAEGDNSRPDPENPYVVPDLDSDLKWLLDGWGIEIPEGKVAGDMNSAMRVQAQGERGPMETYYLPWLQLSGTAFSKDDFVTSQLEVVHIGTAGAIDRRADSPMAVSPLMQSSDQSMRIERDLILFQRDPQVMLRNFKPDNKPVVLAARLKGKVRTAFPDGPTDEGDGKAAEQIKEGDVNAILVADTDILNDLFWVRTQSYFGMEMPQAIANNADFVVNAIDNLSGSTDLISLRSRSASARPFEVVEQIRREAEAQFREREQALQAKLKETESKILELQKESGDGGAILSPEQTQAIDNFRNEQVKTRKELRAVQHELQKNIERLGSLLKFINIGLVPLFIAVLALGAGLYRARRVP